MIMMKAFIIFGDDSRLSLNARNFDDLTASIKAHQVVGNNLDNPISKVTIYFNEV